MDEEMENLAEILARVIVLEKRMAVAEHNLLRVAEVINQILAAARAVEPEDENHDDEGTSAYL